jgi:hypothetical protein
MQFSAWCAPWKVANGAKNLVLQALQSQQVGICRKFPGGGSISHYGPNECFVDLGLATGYPDVWAFDLGQPFLSLSGRPLILM